MLPLASSYSSIFVFYLFLAVSHNMLAAEAVTYFVGDSDGWTILTESNNWTQGKEFHVGDTLVFNYVRALHNVIQVNSTAYEDCTKDPYTSLHSSGNDALVLSEVGPFWYICGVSDHCENGQKLTINVLP